MAEVLDRIRIGGRIDHYETTRRRKDGSTIAISLTVSPIHDAAGGVVGASAIARDSAGLGRERDQALRAAQYARGLIEASRNSLAVISPQGKITDVNEAMVRMTGAERGQLVGADFSDYFTEPDRAREVYRQAFAQGIVTDYPLTIRHTGGDLTEVLYDASVYKDADGSVPGVVTAARDETNSRLPSFLAPGSAWPASGGSSNATAAAPGPKAPWAAAPPFTSPWTRHDAALFATLSY